MGVYKTQHPTYTLCNAAANGYLEGVKRLMEKESRIPYEYGWAIIEAAKRGHDKIVKYLIEFKDKSIPEEIYKDMSVAKILQKRRVLWDAEEALKKAINNSHFEVVKCFLQHRIGKFSKVLGRTAETGNLKMVKCLVEQISDLTRIKKGAFDEAAYKAVLGGFLDILKYLVGQGANIHVMYGADYEQENALIAACRLGNPEMVEYLVAQGVDIHARGEAALFKAISHSYLVIVKYLVDQGADIHAQEGHALYLATLQNDPDILKYLVDQGADIHAHEERALITASQRGSSEMVEYLVDKGANIFAQGEMALRLACSKRYLPIVKFLVNQEANALKTKVLTTG
ncbi:MAG: hypothetical protein K0R52_444 [Alphaproteobacteria bacterium]|nr:hypothetical protein [Alphaproteobacteria bacterium]